MTKKDPRHYGDLAAISESGGRIFRHFKVIFTNVKLEIFIRRFFTNYVQLETMRFTQVGLNDECFSGDLIQRQGTTKTDLIKKISTAQGTDVQAGSDHERLVNPC